MAGVARTRNAGEIPSFPAMAPPPGASSRASRRSHLIWAIHFRSNGPDRPIPLRRVILLKRPWKILDVEPAVQSGFQRIRFLFWKTYFSFNRFKIKFHLITVLSLPLIAHNLFVLTPNWTVQLALDSSFRDLSVHIICHHVFEL